MQTQICSKCGIEKSITDFHKDKKDRKLGLMHLCKLCNTAKATAWREANQELYKKRQKTYYQVNRKKMDAKTKKWVKSNSEKRKAIIKKYYITHKEQHKATVKACRMANLKKYKETASRWQKNNPDKVKAATKKYFESNKEKINTKRRQKYKTDPKFALNHNISEVIRCSLKDNKNGRHWEILVGYTLKQLVKHLEKQFTEGMTWENYGLWHVDHKIPISAHNFTKPEHTDFKKAWALKNLQPLWAKDNCVKHNKLITHFQPSLMI